MWPKTTTLAERLRRMAMLLLAVPAFGFALSSGAASAQEPERPMDPDAREAISKVRSPFCPGLMLEICPTTQAQALRDSIEAMAETGVGADSLVELVVGRYGEEYRAYPKRSGAGLLAWLAPPVALLLGLGLVVVALRHMREPAGSRSDADLSDEEQQRLDEALAHMEEDAV